MLSSYSYYKLQPQEEQLLVAVLGRDDATLEQNNPFDSSAACLDDEEPFAEQPSWHTGLPGSQLSQQHSQSCVGEGGEAGAAEPATGSAAEAAAGGLPSEAVAGVVATQSTPQPDRDSHRSSAERSCHSLLSAASRSSSRSSGSRKRRTVAEIDAMLEALQAGYSIGHASSLGSVRPSNTAISTGRFQGHPWTGAQARLNKGGLHTTRLGH